LLTATGRWLGKECSAFRTATLQFITPEIMHPCKVKTMRRSTYALNLGILCTSLLFGALPVLVQAQVVQLPSTRSLGYSGSVWVPDGGTSAIGGQSGVRYGSRNSGWGPFSNSASGSSLSSSGVSASVQIIDLAALDAALLAGTSASGATATPPTDTTASSPDGSNAVAGGASSGSATDEPAALDRSLSSQGAASTAGSPEQGVALDRGQWQRVLAGGDNPVHRNASLVESDIRYYVRKGEAAEDAGSLLAARVYYKMARDLMTPELIERYERQVAERKAAEEARLKSEVEAVRRRF
jgi:hypothetical protein